MEKFATIPPPAAAGGLPPLPPAAGRLPPLPPAAGRLPPLPPQGIKVRPLDQSWQSFDQRLDQILEQIPDGPVEIKVTEECPTRTQDEVVISIKAELEEIDRSDYITNWSKLCIYKIPKYLHEMHDRSYSPQTVSIGPYYNGEKHLLAMESHKKRAVNKILMRKKQGIEMYIDAMRELEEKARACYEGVISMNSYEFTKMLVLDGCFVLEILIGAARAFENMGYAPNDPVFSQRESMHLIQRDMIMLENQLPLFVLTRLAQLQLGTQMPTNLVTQLAIKFFGPLLLMDRVQKGLDPNEEMIDISWLNKKDMVHFLDVFRRNLVLPELKRQKTQKWGSSVVDKRPQHMVHCARKLRDVGINFRRGKAKYFWDIRFENGHLEIPKLFIHEGTKSLFLNLIAFEQCHTKSSNDITSYIIFMDNLIDSAEDVSYLQKHGIIEHWLESDSEVADMFNQIGRQGIVFNIEDSYLFDLSTKVKRYYDYRNKYFVKPISWMTTLKEKYLDSPWAYISLFAAFVLLVLTSLQCYYAAYDHYHPSS